MAIVDTSPETLTHVSNEIFQLNPEAQFWIGRVAIGDTVTNEEFYEASLKFRGYMYVHKLGFLASDSLDESGKETDEYDVRSDHFAVVEDIKETARIVGTIRTINKETEDDLLPIEKYFPEVFEDKLPVGSSEVSRFIAAHEDKDLTKHMISFSLMRAATFHALENNIDSYYCIIEEHLRGHLDFIGMPLEVLGESKQIDDLGGELIPVRIKPQEIIDSLKQDKRENVILRSFFKNEAPSGGVGYYTNSFTTGD